MLWLQYVSAPRWWSHLFFSLKHESCPVASARCDFFLRLLFRNLQCLRRWTEYHATRAPSDHHGLLSALRYPGVLSVFKMLTPIGISTFLLLWLGPGFGSIPCCSNLAFFALARLRFWLECWLPAAWKYSVTATVSRVVFHWVTKRFWLISSSKVRWWENFTGEHLTQNLG